MALLACEGDSASGGSGFAAGIDAPGFEDGNVSYYADGEARASTDSFCGDQVEGDGCVGAGPRADVCTGTTVADAVLVDGERFDVLCYATGSGTTIHDATSLDSSLNLHGDAGNTLIVVGRNANDSARGDLNLDADAHVAVLGAGATKARVEGNLNAHRGKVSLRRITLGGDASFNLHGTARCDGCYSFDDVDGDRSVFEVELEGAPDCDPS